MHPWRPLLILLIDWSSLRVSHDEGLSSPQAARLHTVCPVDRHRERRLRILKASLFSNVMYRLWHASAETWKNHPLTAGRRADMLGMRRNVPRARRRRVVGGL